MCLSLYICCLYCLTKVVANNTILKDLLLSTDIQTEGSCIYLILWRWWPLWCQAGDDIQTHQQFIRCHWSQAVTAHSFCCCKTSVGVYGKLFMAWKVLISAKIKMLNNNVKMKCAIMSSWQREVISCCTGKLLCSREESQLLTTNQGQK